MLDFGFYLDTQTTFEVALICYRNHLRCYNHVTGAPNRFCQRGTADHRKRHKAFLLAQPKLAVPQQIADNTTQAAHSCSTLCIASRLSTQRVYMCGSDYVEPPQPDPKWFGTLKNLPSEILHDMDVHSQIVLQDFNNLTDVHIMHIIVEQANGIGGMAGLCLVEIEDGRELRFYSNQPAMPQRLRPGSSYIEPQYEPIVCTGPRGWPEIVVFSKVKLKKCYYVVNALASFYMLECRMERLKQALLQYLKSFPKADLKQASQAFGSTPLAFLTHLARFHVSDAPLKGHMRHTFLSPSTNTSAIHVPAFTRKDLEGYTLADVGSRDISLVHGGIVTYTYHEGNTYHLALNELGLAKIPPEAIVG